MSLYLTNGGASLVLATGGIPVATGLTTPLADGVHPRLLMAPDGYTNVPTLSSVKAGIVARDSTMFQTWVDYWDHTAQWNHATPQWSHALAYGFLYQMAGGTPVSGISFGHSSAQYGAKARSIAQSKTASGSPGNYYEVSNAGGGQPAAYTLDLIWDLLDGADKSAVATWAANLDVSGIYQAGNSQSVGSGTAALCLGLLLDGEDLSSDAWAAARVASYSTYVRNPQRGYSDLNSYRGGLVPLQEYFYWMVYTQRELFAAEEAYRVANNISRAIHYGGSDVDILRKIGQQAVLNVMPDPYPRTPDATYPGGYKLQVWKSAQMGASSMGQYAVHDNKTVFALYASAGLFSDVDPTNAGLARWFLEERCGIIDAPASYVLSFVPARFVWYDNQAWPTSLSPADAGLTPGMGSSTDGWWTFRPSYDVAIDDPWVSFCAPMRCAGWNTLSRACHIEINRKGDVLHTSGGFQGHDHGGSPRFGNRLVFPNTDLTNATVVIGEDNFGAMRRHFSEVDSIGDNFVSTFWAVDAKGYLGGARRQRLNAGDLHYVYADLTRQYSSTLSNSRDYFDATGRVSSVIRQLVYFTPSDADVDPMRLVIYDRATTTDAKYQKRCEWHVPTAPTMNGTTSAGPSRGATGTEGKTQATDTTLVTWTNGSKAWLSPLLPATRRVITIGGPNVGTGHHYRSHDLIGSVNDSHEYESAYGCMEASAYITVDQNNDPGEAARPYVGWGRVETVDEGGTLTAVFLHALEVTDTGASQSTTGSISGSGWVGARIGDRIAVFGELSDAKTDGTFTIPASFSGKLLVCGLNPSTLRTLDPDAHGTINALSAGEAYTATCGADGTFYVDFVADGTGCTITVS